MVDTLKAGRGLANRAAVHLLAGQLLVVASAFVVNVLSARTLGPAGRGHLALLLQITYVASMVGVSGTDRVYPAMLSTRPTTLRAASELARVVLPTALYTAVLMIPVGIVVERDGEHAVFIALAIAVITLGNVVASVLRAATAASSSGTTYLIATAGGQLFLLTTSAVFLTMGGASIAAWVTAYAAAATMPALVAWVVLRADPQPKVRLASAGVWRIRRAGVTVLPATAAAMVMLRSDRLLLPALGSFEQAGWYIVVATLTELIVWPATSWVDAHVPVWRQHHEAGTLNRLRPLLLLAAYGAAAAVAVTAAGWLLLVPIFGAAFTPSLALLAPLAAAAGIYGVSRGAVGLALASGNLRAPLWTDIPAMVCAVASYLLLIPTFGAMGAAWGSLLGYSVAAAVSVALALRRTPAPDTAATANTHMNLVS